MSRGVTNTNQNQGQKVLANVYKGAAFLILIVGCKTLIQTLDVFEIPDFISIILWFISLAAIIVEFILLIKYANFVSSQKVTNSESNTANLTNSIDGNKIDGLIQSNNSVIDALRESSKRQADSAEQIKKHTDAIIKIGDGLDSLVSSEVDRKVKDAISRLISQNLKNN